MGFIQVMQFIPLLTALVNFIKQAEAKFREPGRGPAKLEWVSAQIQPFLAALGASGLVNAKLIATLTTGIPTVISLIVQIWKLFGDIKPTPAPGPVDPPKPVPTPGFPYSPEVLTSAPDKSRLVSGDVIFKDPNSDRWQVWSPELGRRTPQLPFERLEVIP